MRSQAGEGAGHDGAGAGGSCDAGLDACTSSSACTSACGPHGSCNNAQCACQTGYPGSLCAACASGFHFSQDGKTCTQSKCDPSPCTVAGQICMEPGGQCCAGGCQLGSAQCASGALRVCNTTANGCGAWADAVSCGSAGCADAARCASDASGITVEPTQSTTCYTRVELRQCQAGSSFALHRCWRWRYRCRALPAAVRPTAEVSPVRAAPVRGREGLALVVPAARALQVRVRSWTQARTPLTARFAKQASAPMPEPALAAVTTTVTATPTAACARRGSQARTAARVRADCTAVRTAPAVRSPSAIRALV